METQKNATRSTIALYLSGALRRLAGVCDGAVALDGQGFSKFDSERGHRFASEDPSSWDDNKVRYVRNFLGKYRDQLYKHHGMDLELITVEHLEQTMFVVHKGSDGRFIFAVPAGSEMAGMIPIVWPNATQDYGDMNIWRVEIKTVKAALSVIGFAKRFDLAIPVSVQAALDMIVDPSLKPTHAHACEAVDRLEKEHGPGEPQAMGSSWDASNALQMFG